MVNESQGDSICVFIYRKKCYLDKNYESRKDIIAGTRSEYDEYLIRIMVELYGEMVRGKTEYCCGGLGQGSV